jgi:hypothetical protein
MEICSGGLDRARSGPAGGLGRGAFRDRVFQRPGTLRTLRLTSAFVFASLAVLVIAELTRALA